MKANIATTIMEKITMKISVLRMAGFGIAANTAPVPTVVGPTGTRFVNIAASRALIQSARRNKKLRVTSTRSFWRGGNMGLGAEGLPRSHQPPNSGPGT